MSLTFHIVDVFAERRYAGNPLAVVLDAGDLAAEEMQQIALEMNTAETTFVTLPSRADGSYSVRIFTPVQELPFAVHPTLGTAWVLRHEVTRDAPRSVTLNLGVGSVVVSFEEGSGGSETVWLQAPPVTLGTTCTPDAIAPALGLSVGDIESRVPIQRSSAGISVTIVPLRGLEALRQSQLDLRAFNTLGGGGSRLSSTSRSKATGRAGNPTR